MIFNRDQVAIDLKATAHKEMKYGHDVYVNSN